MVVIVFNHIDVCSPWISYSGLQRNGVKIMTHLNQDERKLKDHIFLLTVVQLGIEMISKFRM